jgi:hypothetical protein
VAVAVVVVALEAVVESEGEMVGLSLAGALIDEFSVWGLS